MTSWGLRKLASFARPATNALAKGTKVKKTPLFLVPYLYVKVSRVIKSFSYITLAAYGLTLKARAEWNSDDTLKEADSLYEDCKYKEAYDLLKQFKDNDESEVLWRLGRLCYELARPLKLDSEKKPLHLEGYNYVNKALELDEKNFAAHKWMFILLDLKAYYEGTKARIEKAYQTKKHIQRACELNPGDGTSWHLLGFWCYAVSDMPWYQRKIASALFATPPSSTFEEALSYFLEAEKAQPNFYSTNLLMLGKTYLKLGDKQKAMDFLERSRDYAVKTYEDATTREEAIKLLGGLK
ncbi:regulator of microtubule dynamics protein 1-like isoform X2 [Artemia franciscana]